MLGSGSFGELYQGLNLKTNELVAIKLEPLDAIQPMLQYEAVLYKKLQGMTGISNMHWYGVEGDYNALVMDLQGPSLHSLFKFCNNEFDMKTILWIAIQMILRVQSMHEHNYLHRDLKPENFLIGHGKKVNTLYLIDFGLSKRFKCPKTGEHIKNKNLPFITGTLRYCSINAHCQKEQSRRDDLESIGFILMYFLNNGYLPWPDIDDEDSKY